MKDYLPEEIKVRNQTFEINFKTPFEIILPTFVPVLVPISASSNGQSVICRGTNEF